MCGIRLCERFAGANHSGMSTRLAKHITDLGITQLEFSRRHGFAASLVCEWAGGTRRPGRDHAIELEEATGGVVPASYWSKVKVVSRRNRKAG